MATGMLTNFNGGSAMRIGYARVSTHDQNLDLPLVNSDANGFYLCQIRLNRK